MRNSRHLLDSFQDADDLLSRELEDLAKHLLECLDGREHIMPSEIISEDHLFNNRLRPENGQRFPSMQKEILFALMEAWHWLFRKGFIALSFQVAPNPLYFVTRKGKGGIPSDAP